MTGHDLNDLPPERNAPGQGRIFADSLKKVLKQGHECQHGKEEHNVYRNVQKAQRQLVAAVHQRGGQRDDQGEHGARRVCQQQQYKLDHHKRGPAHDGPVPLVLEPDDKNRDKNAENVFYRAAVFRADYANDRFRIHGIVTHRRIAHDQKQRQQNESALRDGNDPQQVLHGKILLQPDGEQQRHEPAHTGDRLIGAFACHQHGDECHRADIHIYWDIFALEIEQLDIIPALGMGCKDQHDLRDKRRIFADLAERLPIDPGILTREAQGDKDAENHYKLNIDITFDVSFFPHI